MNRKLITSASVAMLSLAVSMTAMSQGHTFTSIYGRFSLNTPQVFTRYSSVNAVEINGRQYFVSSYRWQFGPDPLAVSFGVTGVDLEKAEPARLLDGIRNMFISRIAANSRLVTDEAIQLGTHPGRRLVIDNAGKQTVAWAFINSDRFYIISSLPSSDAGLADVTNAVKTFRFIDRSDLPSKYQDDFDRGTLTPLQSSGNVPNPGVVDLRVHELKGPVKEVLTKTKPIDPAAPFMNDESDLFDPTGALVRSTRSVNGVTTEIDEYGYLNGKRVYHTERRVVRSNDPTAKPEKGMDLDAPQQDVPQRDVYSLIYETRPDSSPKSFAVVVSDGRTRDKYTFDDKTMILDGTGYLGWDIVAEFDRTARGNSYYRKSTSTFDDKGFVKETIVAKHEPGESYRADGETNYADKKTEELHRFVYEVDSRGNWTKRTEFVVSKKKDGVSEAPFSITLREISYY